MSILELTIYPRENEEVSYIETDKIENIEECKYGSKITFKNGRIMEVCESPREINEKHRR